MDCCNYVPYSHQCYGAPYYEPYDFYPRQHQYHEYYQPYYQQWTSNPFRGTDCADYVYNPKEARIRKAMRERSMGTSPMLARSNVRRTSTQSVGWVQTPTHEELMMQPLGSMPPPVCYPLPAAAADQYLGHMSAYSKLEPPPPSPMLPPQTNYMQASPLAQLQQHAEMWPEYQGIRPRSSSNAFLMNDVPSYTRQSPEINNSLMMEKGAGPETPPSQENEAEKANRLVFDQLDENKMKKPHSAQASTRPPTKPLPDFNEAFGSTERGRFQSPPDPRLAPNKNWDFFFESGPLKFEDYQI